MTEESASSELNKRKWPVFLGPLIFLIFSQLPSPDPFYPLLMTMAGITIWVALWWLTEAVHIAVTSFIPFIFLPSTGIADIKVISAQYMDPILFLFIGGFLLAFAIERWGLHRRLALKILSSTGNTTSSVLGGIMLTSYLISMWISNTATVMMLISAVLAVIHHLKTHLRNEEQHRKISSALLIGLAYSASIGGMATLVGTPTNMIFFRVYNEHFGQAAPVTFTSWMIFAFPISILLLLFTWLILKFFILKKLSSIPFERSHFFGQYKMLGRWSKDEKIVAFVFILTALLWFTRADIELGTYYIKGWASLFSYPQQIQDSTVAVTMALLLFLIPSQTEPGRNLLTWNEASKLPYEILLLFGSGFALAKGFETSGLSNWLAQNLHSLKEVPLIFLILIVCAIVTIISEFASNVASIQLVLPVLISLLGAIHCSPQMLLIPAALAASLGFMLPVATAPNTIVFSSGHIRVREMAIAGILVDIMGILLIAGFSYFFK